ncbi:hypothetical protein ABPG77_006796 [Micractinium sp. CCAP 211/92]
MGGASKPRHAAIAATLRRHHGLPPALDEAQLLQVLSAAPQGSAGPQPADPAPAPCSQSFWGAVRELVNSSPTMRAYGVPERLDQQLAERQRGERGALTAEDHVAMLQQDRADMQDLAPNAVIPESQGVQGALTLQALQQLPKDQVVPVWGAHFGDFPVGRFNMDSPPANRSICYPSPHLAVGPGEGVCFTGMCGGIIFGHLNKAFDKVARRDAHPVVSDGGNEKNGFNGSKDIDVKLAEVQIASLCDKAGIFTWRAHGSPASQALEMVLSKNGTGQLWYDHVVCAGVPEPVPIAIVLGESCNRPCVHVIIRSQHESMLALPAARPGILAAEAAFYSAVTDESPPREALVGILQTVQRVMKPVADSLQSFSHMSWETLQGVKEASLYAPHLIDRLEALAAEDEARGAAARAEAARAGAAVAAEVHQRLQGAGALLSELRKLRSVLEPKVVPLPKAYRETCAIAWGHLPHREQAPPASREGSTPQEAQLAPAGSAGGLAGAAAAQVATGGPPSQGLEGSSSGGGGGDMDGAGGLHASQQREAGGEAVHGNEAMRFAEADEFQRQKSAAVRRSARERRKLGREEGQGSTLPETLQAASLGEEIDRLLAELQSAAAAARTAPKRRRRPAQPRPAAAAAEPAPAAAVTATAAGRSAGPQLHGRQIERADQTQAPEHSMPPADRQQPPAPQAEQQLRLWLHPHDDRTEQAMTAAGYHAHKLLVLRSTKSVQSLLCRLSEMWPKVALLSGSGTARSNALQLHPRAESCPDELQGTAWGGPSLGAKLTVVDIYAALLKPDPFILCYSIASKQAGNGDPSPMLRSRDDSVEAAMTDWAAPPAAACTVPPAAARAVPEAAAHAAPSAAARAAPPAAARAERQAAACAAPEAVADPTSLELLLLQHPPSKDATENATQVSSQRGGGSGVLDGFLLEEATPWSSWAEGGVHSSSFGEAGMCGDSCSGGYLPDGSWADEHGYSSGVGDGLYDGSWVEGGEITPGWGEDALPGAWSGLPGASGIAGGPPHHVSGELGLGAADCGQVLPSLAMPEGIASQSLQEMDDPAWVPEEESLLYASTTANAAAAQVQQSQHRIQGRGKEEMFRQRQLEAQQREAPEYQDTRLMEKTLSAAALHTGSLYITASELLLFKAVFAYKHSAFSAVEEAPGGRIWGLRWTPGRKAFGGQTKQEALVSDLRPYFTHHGVKPGDIISIRHTEGTGTTTLHLERGQDNQQEHDDVLPGDFSQSVATAEQLQQWGDVETVDIASIAAASAPTGPRRRSERCKRKRWREEEEEEEEEEEGEQQQQQQLGEPTADRHLVSPWKQGKRAFIPGAHSGVGSPAGCWALQGRHSSKMRKHELLAALPCWLAGDVAVHLGVAELVQDSPPRYQLRKDCSTVRLSSGPWQHTVRLASSRRSGVGTGVVISANDSAALREAWAHRQAADGSVPLQLQRASDEGGQPAWLVTCGGRGWQLEPGEPGYQEQQRALQARATAAAAMAAGGQVLTLMPYHETLTVAGSTAVELGVAERLGPRLYRQLPGTDDIALLCSADGSDSSVGMQVVPGRLTRGGHTIAGDSPGLAGAFSLTAATTTALHRIWGPRLAATAAQLCVVPTGQRDGRPAWIVTCGGRGWQLEPGEPGYQEQQWALQVEAASAAAIAAGAQVLVLASSTRAVSVSGSKAVELGVAERLGPRLYRQLPGTDDIALLCSADGSDSSVGMQVVPGRLTRGGRIIAGDSPGLAEKFSLTAATTTALRRIWRLRLNATTPELLVAPAGQRGGQPAWLVTCGGRGWQLEPGEPGYQEQQRAPLAHLAV